MQALSALPDIPTFEEEGVDFYAWGSVKGIAVPKDAPRETINALADISPRTPS